MPYAAIDLGSNSLLLAIEADDGSVLHDEAHVVGLGKGLGDMGRFDPARMAHAEQVLTRFVEIAASHGVPPHRVRACATSGARRATNAGEFFDRIRAELGLDIQTISGEQEAVYAYLGALSDLGEHPKPVLVIDLGGGSTELIIGSGSTMHFRISLEVGAVRLTEAFGLDGPEPDLEGARRHLDDLLGAVAFPQLPAHAVAVAGTATTLAAMTLGLQSYDGAKVHGSRLNLDDLLHWRDTLLSASPERRRELAAVSIERAPYLAAGACVIAAVLDYSGLSACQVSNRGLRFGVVEMLRNPDQGGNLT